MDRRPPLYRHSASPWSSTCPGSIKISTAVTIRTRIVKRAATWWVANDHVAAAALVNTRQAGAAYLALADGSAGRHVLADATPRHARHQQHDRERGSRQ